MSTDRLMVKFKSNTPSAAIDAFKATNSLTEETGPVATELAKIGAKLLHAPQGQGKGLAKAYQNHPLLDNAEEDGDAYGVFTPNDPSYVDQWHLTKVKAAAAWDTNAGDPSVIIGVVDTGADFNHPDLATNLIAGPSYVEGVTTSMDDQGHGTAVSGVSVAVFNNGLGVAGIAPRCRVRICKALDSTSWGKYSWMASSIINHADQPGVKVINISAGGTSSSYTMQSAVDYAWGKGVVVVAAAGNGGSTVLNYPAACNNVVAVSSVENNDTRSGWSSYGSHIDVCAPGSGILTTHLGGGYAAWSGTSFSSPTVAGAVALIRSVNPGLSAAETVALLKSTAVDIGSPTEFGDGVLDAEAAVLAAAIATPGNPPVVAPPAISFVAPASGEVVSGNISVVALVSGDNLTQVVFKVDTVTKSTVPVNSAGQVSIPWDTSGVADGSRVLQVILSQTGGATATANRTVSVLNAADAIAPTVVYTNVANGLVVPRKILKVAMTASDNVDPAPTIKLSINGLLVFTGTGPTATYNWNTGKVKPGTYSLSAVAYDSSGNASTPAVVSVIKA